MNTEKESITADGLRAISDAAANQIDAKAYDFVCRRARAAARHGRYRVVVNAPDDSEKIDPLVRKLKADGFVVKIIDGRPNENNALDISWSAKKRRK